MMILVLILMIIALLSNLCIMFMISQKLDELQDCIIDMDMAYLKLEKYFRNIN